MGTISSGVGLFSGIDFEDTVDKLIALEARPRDLTKDRISKLEAQRTALLDISARVSSMLSRVNSLLKPSFFQSVTATSSLSDVLSVSADTGVSPGSYTFRVRSLATTHQLASNGYRSATSSLKSGTVTVESAQARVYETTTLEELNGYGGVQRGEFKLIDANGDEAVIDTTGMLTLDEVIDAVNSAGLNIKADLSGESLRLTETTGGEIRIREIDGGSVAASLGFSTGNTYSGSGEIVGGDLMGMTANTPLSVLNDGLGVSLSKGGGDFIMNIGGTEVKADLSGVIKAETRLDRLNGGEGVDLGIVKITLRSGATKEVDLSSARTIGDVKDLIEEGAENVDGESQVSVVLSGGRLILTDESKPHDEDNPDKFAFSITDVSGRASVDLGLSGDADSDTIDGSTILRVETIGEVLAAINYGAANYPSGDSDTPYVTAFLSEDGRSIQLMANGSPGTSIELQTGNSTALSDLGFTAGAYETGEPVSGQRVIGGLNTVLLSTLNGGQGIEGGVFRISLNGSEVTVDASGAETLRDVLDLINEQAEAAGVAVEATYDSTGRGLKIQNLLDDGSEISVSDVDGEMASALGISGTAATISGANLQRQYIAGNTALADLNNGKGVGSGTIRITDSEGLITDVSISSTSTKTIGDIISAINSSGANVVARINDKGDGIVIEDQAGGADGLTIESKSGTLGRDLNLIGSADNGVIDGSYEYEFDVSGLDSISDLAERINEQTALASANIFNDGSSVSPYRLSITSSTSGLGGELIIDGGTTGLNFSTLTRAQNASITMGDEGGILITSSSNTFDDIVDGMTINVTSLSDDPINVTVAEDVDTITAAVAGFVSDFNDVISRISQLTSYDSETEKKGILLGDSTTSVIENRLYRMVTGSSSAYAGNITRLSQLGVSMGEGGTLSFNEDKFREAFANDPDAVIQYFTDETTGRAVEMKEIIDSITGDDGLIDRRDDTLSDQQEYLNDRVEALDDLLERKRERLLEQFYAMEESLASMQTQQETLSSWIESLSST